MKRNAKQNDNNLRGKFEASRLDQLAQQLEWRAWTRILLTQRLATLDSKLAAGDMPVLDAVTEPRRSGGSELIRTEISEIDELGHPNDRPDNAFPTATDDDFPVENFAGFMES